MMKKLTGTTQFDKGTLQLFSATRDTLEEMYETATVKELKVANDDMSALSEYPSLYSKAQDLGDKLERAHGQMSSAQWERYNKLTVKMLEAAQEIQKIQK